jgi:hypothetical protein
MLGAQSSERKPTLEVEHSAMHLPLRLHQAWLLMNVT